MESSVFKTPDKQTKASKNASRFTLLVQSYKLDFAIILFLSIVSFIAFSTFFNEYGEIMIVHDSYKHFEIGMAMSTGTDISKSLLTDTTTSPFIKLISILFPLFQDHVEALFYIRLAVIVFSIQFVLFFYLITRKIFNPFFSVAAAVMVCFLPVLMSYSSSLHDDIFAFAMGITSLYFSIKPRKLLQLSLATIFIIITGLTRLDILMVFIIPYLIGLSYYLSTKIKLNFFIIVGVSISLVLVPSYFVIQASDMFYFDDWFDHNVMAQIVAFLTWDTIKMILESSVEITGESESDIEGFDSLNKLYIGILVLGLAFFVINHFEKFVKIIKLKFPFGDSEYTILYIVIFLTLSLITLGGLHLAFTPLGDGQIQIDDEMLPRYMIGVRSFVILGFIYGLILLTNSVGKIIRRLPNAPKSLDSIDASSQNERILKHKITKNEYMSFVFVAFIIILFVDAMWDTATRFYENKSTQIEAYYKGSSWISENLDDNDMIFLPMPQTFWSLNPSLKDNSYIYNDLWYFENGTKIYVRPQITQEEKMIVHQRLLDFVSNRTNNVKYFVVDWVDSHGKWATGIGPIELMGKNACEKIANNFRTAAQFGFNLPHSNWGNSLVICTV